MNRDSNTIYMRQLAILTFFIVISYKIVMLPKYLAMGVDRDFVIGMAIAMLIEMCLFGLTFYIISYSNISHMYVNIWIKRILYLFVFVSVGIKFVVLSVETLDYISTLLFQEGRWLFIILTLFPALTFIAYKGINTIARLGEIVVWAVVLTFAFSLLFLRADMEIDNMLPILDNGPMKLITSFDKHSLWFGDYLPLLVVDIDKRRGKLDRILPPIGIVISYVMTVGFYLLFIAIYGDVAPYIKYAFSNIGIYNSISNLLGGVDFPIVCVWILMAIVKLSFMLYAMKYALTHIFTCEYNKKVDICISLLLMIFFMLILSFAVSGVEEMYAFATSYVRYIVFGLEYIVLITMLILTIVGKKKYRIVK